MAAPLTIIRGQKHHRAKYPDALVNRARTLSKRGYNPAEVMHNLKDEGHDVPFYTLMDWLRFRTRLLS